MPLYIKNPDVSDQADLLVKLTGKTKTEAVAVAEALSEAINRARQRPRMADAVAALQDQIKTDGFMRVGDQ